MTEDTALECDSLTVAYGHEPVLANLDLTVRGGEVLALLGPSGSGKSTVLHAVAGFLTLAEGRIRIAGEEVASPRRSVPSERRDVAMVFQHYALWPHLSVREIVAYPLRRARVGRASARSQAQELLARMEIADLADRRPAELSGGQQQRVGLARALARHAGLYLFDEPTAHLDTHLRSVFQEELAERVGAVRAAAIYATHDAGEALALADRVALLRDGAVVQTGTPRRVYERPADLWAARLTGPAHLLACPRLQVRSERVRATVAGVDVDVPGGAATERADGRAAPEPAQTAATMLVRPDWAVLDGPLPATVARATYRGPHTDYLLDTPAGRLAVREIGPPRLHAGQPTGWALRRAWVLPRDDEAEVLEKEEPAQSSAAGRG